MKYNLFVFNWFKSVYYFKTSILLTSVNLFKNSAIVSSAIND